MKMNFHAILKNNVWKKLVSSAVGVILYKNLLKKSDRGAWPPHVKQLLHAMIIILQHFHSKTNEVLM